MTADVLLGAQEVRIDYTITKTYDSFKVREVISVPGAEYSTRNIYTIQVGATEVVAYKEETLEGHSFLDPIDLKYVPHMDLIIRMAEGEERKSLEARLA